MPEKLRKTQTDTDLTLSEEAKQLLELLDESVRPVETAKCFPRIMNSIATLWKRPLLMDNYFVALMIDQRGNRGGFSLRIVGEIATLREYYSTTIHAKTSAKAWDKVDP